MLGAGEWIALAAFALSVLGGLMHVVWLLARMNERLDTLCKRVESLEKVETQIRDHEVRITKLECR